MRTVLVTGYNGFIGKNLIAALERLQDIEILKIGSKHSPQQLKEYASKADFVFHLAGVNRPNDNNEFNTGNREFTEQLLSILKEVNHSIPFLISSSSQSIQDNPYGVSKKAAEDAVFQYGEQTGANVYVYRLPNVFGKWCRPNYNSVVATWCYNIAHNLPIQINNPLTELNLVYVDDVVEEFIHALNGNENRNPDGFCSVSRTFKISLGYLSDTLHSFRESRETLKMVNLEGKFEKFLYTTYLSYLPEKEFAYNLEMKHDQRGWLAEFIKSDQLGQIFISKTKPGITRGNHWHHTKVEKFLVIEGEASIKFRKIDGDEVLDYKVTGDNLRVLDIPPGYTHSITNIGDKDVITLFWANEIFTMDRPDTYFLEV